MHKRKGIFKLNRLQGIKMLCSITTTTGQNEFFFKELGNQ